MKKLKIAIFDLTDCEGCELQFLNFREKFDDFLEKVEIVNWRLLQNKNDFKNIDYAFIEGTPIKPEEIKILIKIRENSKFVVALGTCAATGGIPALIDPEKRNQAFQDIYPGKDPKNSLAAKPVSHYIKIDHVISGCPTNTPELERFFAKITRGIIPQEKTYPVCLPCKVKQNKCLLLEGKHCLGPITQAGCNAACPSFGFPCFGCLGPIKDANLKAIKKRFKDIGLSDDEIDEWIKTTWRNLETNHYKDKK